MIAKLNRVRPYVLSLVRIIAGLMFMMHGIDKVFGGVLTGRSTPPGIAMTAGYIEFTTGVFMSLGLMTRLAAFLASGTMAFAYFMGHAQRGFLPIVNNGELAVLYCWLFFYLVFAGAGPLSLDAYLLEHDTRG